MAITPTPTPATAAHGSAEVYGFVILVGGHERLEAEDTGAAPAQRWDPIDKRGADHGSLRAALPAVSRRRAGIGSR